MKKMVILFLLLCNKIWVHGLTDDINEDRPLSIVKRVNDPISIATRLPPLPLFLGGQLQYRAPLPSPFSFPSYPVSFTFYLGISWIWKREEEEEKPSTLSLKGSGNQIISRVILEEGLRIIRVVKNEEDHLTVKLLDGNTGKETDISIMAFPEEREVPNWVRYWWSKDKMGKWKCTHAKSFHLETTGGYEISVENSTGDWEVTLG